MSGHAHSHDHGHSHADHAHCQPGHPHRTLQPAVLGWAMVFTLSLVVAEVFGGIFGRSVALLNDAVHNLSDVPALGISYLAMRWAERPADSEKTYGYHRAGTLAAFTNAFVLVFLSLWLGYEALERFRSPVAVVEAWMIWTSMAALAVNGGISLALVRGRGDLNLRSILIHNFGDALSNIAIIVGAVLIGKTGAHWIDPLLGLGIGLLVLWSSVGILREFPTCIWTSASACSTPSGRLLRSNFTSNTPPSGWNAPVCRRNLATSCPNPQRNSCPAPAGINNSTRIKNIGL